ncbi:L-aspartate oxidase, partial [Candidatus Hakubella thermalkaliphila]
FMKNYHRDAELAPRDIVSRAIISEMVKTESSHVYLDMTHLEKDFVRKRFPQIYSTCLLYSVEITNELIPVSPAAHYIMGGVKTDVNGVTSIKKLYAAGEVACTGVDGANRLASNSLLEGLVDGARTGRAALEFGVQSSEFGVSDYPQTYHTIPEHDEIRMTLRKLM